MLKTNTKKTDTRYITTNVQFSYITTHCSFNLSMFDCEKLNVNYAAGTLLTDNT